MPKKRRATFQASILTQVKRATQAPHKQKHRRANLLAHRRAKQQSECAQREPLSVGIMQCVSNVVRSASPAPIARAKRLDGASARRHAPSHRATSFKNVKSTRMNNAPLARFGSRRAYQGGASTAHDHVVPRAVTDAAPSSTSSVGQHPLDDLTGVEIDAAAVGRCKLTLA